MKFTSIIKFSLVVTGSALLVACSTPQMYYDSSKNVDDMKSKITEQSKQQEDQLKNNPAVVVHDGMYISHERIDLKKQPAWLQEHISLHGDELPFSFYSRSIVRSNHVLTTYQQGLDQSMMISMNYDGTIAGALDALAARTGFVYEVDGSQVYWKAFITKTFNIAFMPGDSNYMVGGNSSSGSGGSSSSQSSGSSSGSSSAGSGGGQGQYSNLQGALSVWDDLKSTIQSMLSSSGTVIVSQSTTTITVRDYPARVKQVEEYVEKINAILSQQVMIKVQVLQVNLSKNFNNGIDWGLVTSFSGGTKFKFSGDYSQPLSISPLGNTGGGAIGFTNSNGTSSFLVNALSQQGKVSISTEPTVVTTNNQVASIAITQTRGYLAEIQNTTSTSQQQGGQAATTLTPGQAVTGLTLYVLPKIMDGKVYLQISSDLSTLVQIRTLSSSLIDTTTSQQIQVPDMDEKEFNQRGVIDSGATLILAGFKQMSNQTSAEQFLQSQALGGQGAEEQDEETIVLITPYVMKDNSPIPGINE